MLEPLARGGQSLLYLAEDRESGEKVVIKTPAEATGPANVETFRQEARRTASLSHPGIVRVLDAELEARPPFFVMEWTRSVSLDRILAALAARPPRERENFRSVLDQAFPGFLSPEARGETSRWPDVVADLVRQVAEVLVALHERGLVHRDIKPGNLLIDPQLRVRLTDFGVAATMDADRPRDGRAASGVGTLPYAAPEQLLDPDPVDPRSDLYSLGIVVLECLDLRHPIPGEDAPEIRVAALEGRRHPRPPGELARRAALWSAPDRRQRPASARDVLQQCQRLGGRRLRRVAGLIGGAALATIAALFSLAGPSEPGPARAATEAAPEFRAPALRLGRDWGVNVVVHADGWRRNPTEWDWVGELICPAEKAFVRTMNEWALRHLPAPDGSPALRLRLLGVAELGVAADPRSDGRTASAVHVLLDEEASQWTAPAEAPDGSPWCLRGPRHDPSPRSSAEGAAFFRALLARLLGDHAPSLDDPHAPARLSQALAERGPSRLLMHHPTRTIPVSSVLIDGEAPANGVVLLDLEGPAPVLDTRASSGVCHWHMEIRDDRRTLRRDWRALAPFRDYGAYGWAVNLRDALGTARVMVRALPPSYQADPGPRLPGLGRSLLELGHGLEEASRLLFRWHERSLPRGPRFELGDFVRSGAPWIAIEFRVEQPQVPKRGPTRGRDRLDLVARIPRR